MPSEMGSGVPSSQCRPEAGLGLSFSFIMKENLSFSFIMKENLPPGPPWGPLGPQGAPGHGFFHHPGLVAYSQSGINRTLTCTYCTSVNCASRRPAADPPPPTTTTTTTEKNIKFPFLCVDFCPFWQSGHVRVILRVTALTTQSFSPNGGFPTRFVPDLMFSGGFLAC